MALPNEHGGWGLLIEPILLGLVLAPSLAAAGLAVAAVAAFLARHPLRLALSDIRRGARYPRTGLAVRVASGYALAGVAGLAVAVAHAPLTAFVPVLLAAPLGLVQLAYDARLRGRELLPELAGGVALGAVAPAVVLAGGWSAPAAFALWLLLAARVAVSVLYVRARLRAARGLAPDRRPAFAAHAGALVLVTGLAARGWSPWLALPAFVALAARALHGLRHGAPVLPPRHVGFQEMGYGALMIVLLAAGYGLGL